ncbi:MAG TPA: hypothetical protein VKE41_00235 [Roseiflexaceae bacterium]|nr:hypothetical protein [Roseiflexaceae bacterium]
MFHYYEIVLHTSGRDRVVRRVPTRRGAEHYIAELIRADLVSSKAIRYERRRGLHPWSVALLCGVLSLPVLFIPLGWISIGLALVLIALTIGFLTSGRSWIAGGPDDR